MTVENCLIEISVRFFKVGEPYWSDCLKDSLWKTEPQMLPIEQSSEKQDAFWDQFQTQQDVYFQADNCSFSFQSFGQGTSEDWTNPLDWTIDMIGLEEVFRDWLSDIEKLAISILGEANKKAVNAFRPEPLSNCVNFVTAWEYHGFQVPETSYGGGDWDEEWKLLGVVDLANIKNSLYNTHANIEGG